MPQRSLILRYKLLLDHTCDNLACGHARCVDHRIEIGFLVSLNPRSTYSMKVTHNLGKNRIARLLRMVEPRRAAPRACARALAISSRGSRRKIVGVTD